MVINDREVTIILNVYKTSAKYGQIRHTFTKGVADIIRKSLTQKPRQYVFIKQAVFDRIEKNDEVEECEDNKCANLLYASGLSSFVSAMLKKAGVKTDKLEINELGGGINKGSISLLRHAKISEELKKIRSEAEREALAASMAHSPMTQISYVRKMKIDKLDEDEKLKIEKKAENKPDYTGPAKRQDTKKSSKPKRNKRKK